MTSIQTAAPLDRSSTRGTGTAASHRIPDTRGGRAFRRVLMVVGISSIVGIADQARALFWRAVSGPPAHGGMGVAQRLIILTGWAIMCWCAVRAFRTHALPPAWVAFAAPLLIWTYLLWPG